MNEATTSLTCTGRLAVRPQKFEPSEVSVVGAREHQRRLCKRDALQHDSRMIPERLVKN